MILLTEYHTMGDYWSAERLLTTHTHSEIDERKKVFMEGGRSHHGLYASVMGLPLSRLTITVVSAGVLGVEQGKRVGCGL